MASAATMQVHHKAHWNEIQTQCPTCGKMTVIYKTYPRRQSKIGRALDMQEIEHQLAVLANPRELLRRLLIHHRIGKLNDHANAR